MIQITPQMRILVAVQPIDFRKGIDGLAKVCRETFKSDPFSGSAFVFCNRRRTAIKILVFDGQGYWLALKRLSSGRFCWWPESSSEPVSSLEAHQLQLLIWNGNPTQAQTQPMWRRVALTP
jgi:transposase